MPRVELGTSSLPRKRSTTELHRLVTGFEPATFSLEGWRSTNWATPALFRCVGRAGFEPAKVKTNRFTVCPRWPLEYLPKFKYFKELSRWRDSNPRPADYKSAALASKSAPLFKRWVANECLKICGLFLDLVENPAKYFLVIR